MTRKDGPVSEVFPVHVTSMRRAVPFASHGFAIVPSPLEPSGQSCVGLAAAAVAAWVADGAGGGAGAVADGGVTAALLDGAPEPPFSSQPVLDVIRMRARAMSGQRPAASVRCRGSRAARRPHVVIVRIGVSSFWPSLGRVPGYH